MLRWFVTTMSAVMLSAGLVVSPGPASEIAVAAPSPSITWRGCSSPELAYDDLQCGTLEVLLDPADPTGATVRLALTRKLHTASFRGVMLTNPGGPGGSGLSLPSISDYVPGNVGASYDWIGFDPRAVGASTPSLHCSSGYFGFARPSYVPSTRAIGSYWLTKNNRYATACAGSAGQRALLRHMTSLDTVRDMESIRVALGVQKISYYGFSYGTYLGELYATRYPLRVGRFVLDGVVNPARVWYDAMFDQDRGFQANSVAFWRYLAAHPSSFHLGKRWRGVQRGYYRTLSRLHRRPAAGGRLGPAELADVMLDAAYYVYDWDVLGRGYSDLVRRQRGAALLKRYRASTTQDDNDFAVYNAVECTDTPWPGLQRTLKDTRAVYRRAPFATWGDTWFNGPCLTWRAPSHPRPGVSGRGLAAKLLLISETRDAATPFSGALEVRKLFPSASLVAGAGTTHASSLSGVACVDNAVAGYLRTGIVPTRLSGVRADRSCPGVKPPDPARTGGGARSRPVDALSPILRRELTAAQRTGR